MQLLVVALIMPSLMIMSRTRAYSLFRIAGAVFACVASGMWLVDRLLDVKTPVDAGVNMFSQSGILCATLLFLASLACMMFARSAVIKS